MEGTGVKILVCGVSMCVGYRSARQCYLHAASTRTVDPT